MNQTRLGSLIEATMNTAIGLVINVAAQQIIYPMFGWTPSLAVNLAVAGLFTIISIVRGYVLRRWFNARLQRAAARMAKAVS